MRRRIDPILEYHPFTCIGVHQGDSMSLVLFLIAVQAFQDTPKLQTQTVNFAFLQKVRMIEPKQHNGGD